MSKFKVGDIIRGTSETRYMITDTNMTKAKVIGLSPDVARDIRIEILEHRTDKNAIGRRLAVSSEYFELVEAQPKYKVGDKVDILDGSKIKDYTGGWVSSSMGEHIGKTATVARVTRADKPSYLLEEFGFRWDERGLKPANDEKIIIYRNGDTVVAKNVATKEEAKAVCSKDDTFDFGIGAKLALDRLMKKVDIPPVGTRIKIIEAGSGARGANGCSGVITDKCSTNGLFQSQPGFNVDIPGRGLWRINLDAKYEIIKNLQLKVGCVVRVTDTGEGFTTYDAWSGLKGYESHFVRGKHTTRGKEYKVLYIGKHDHFTMYDDRCILLIQDPDTTQVFIISDKGVEVAG